jgi:hypothetical protein
MGSPRFSETCLSDFSLPPNKQSMMSLAVDFMVKMPLVPRIVTRDLRSFAGSLVAGALVFSCITPVRTLASTDAAGTKTPPTSPVANLTIGIGECPTRDASFVSPIPVVGALASRAVASLAGAAVDSAVQYLTQERVAATKGLASLGPTELDLLFNRGQCLYAYLYTVKLWRHFNNSSSIPGEGANPLQLPLRSSDLDVIDNQQLTNFMAVISFVPAKDTRATGTSRAASEGYAYYKPYIWRAIYPHFIDTKCPAFRDCGKRDVALSLVLKSPTAPDPSKTENKAFALGQIYQHVEPRSVERSLSGRYLEWFALSTSLPYLANMELTLIETSKPGAVANALAESLKGNREAIIKVVTP